VLGNNKDSPAFYLANQGYDVWLGNNRGVFPNHNTHNPKDKEYWDWCLDDLAKYDFPAMLEYVISKTNRSQLIYMGHSQGNTQAFLGLSMNPQLCQKLQLFIALAPAVFIHPPKHWALQHLVNIYTNGTFELFFGKKAFIPSMCFMQKYLPAFLFAHMSYNMFCYLFNWGDDLWKKSRKVKYFLFSPRPVSCKLLMHWCSIIKEGRLHSFNGSYHENCNADGAANTGCNLKDITCPVALMYSTGDSLVHGKKLVQEMRQHNCLFHVEEFSNYEHVDMVWAQDTKNTIYSKMAFVIEKAQAQFKNIN